MPRVVLEAAARLKSLPPYPFLELARMKREALAAGRPLIDLGIGDPDVPTAPAVISAMSRAMRDPATHRYPLGNGNAAFRGAVARWFRGRFGVTLDPVREVCALIGSKEGIAHFPWAYVNPGERVLVPDPAYPVFATSTTLCGARPVVMPLVAGNAFLPDLEALSRKLRGGLRVKLMFLNYPNNPTAACATLDFFRRVVALASRYGFAVAHDAAYTEIWQDAAHRPPSIMQVPGAREVAIEFHSLSKTLNMTGWRLGFAVGNAKLVGALADFKGNVDSGQFEAIQHAGAAGLRVSGAWARRMSRIYRARRDRLSDALRMLGLPAPRPEAAIYLWVPLPPRRTSAGYAAWLLEKADLLVTPGAGFGRYGEGYLRVSLTVPDAGVREACHRLERLAVDS
ncbi:MAG: aminotransferase class I/II-fold pyridoxal phosphate-dependent enzyme [Candidatus Coatesbacteria bacterium]